MLLLLLLLSMQWYSGIGSALQNPTLFGLRRIAGWTTPHHESGGRRWTTAGSTLLRRLLLKLDRHLLLTTPHRWDEVILLLDRILFLYEFNEGLGGGSDGRNHGH
jgi:hypothetical protein